MSMAQKQALRLPHLAVIVGIGLFLTIPLLISNTPSGHDFFFHVMFSHHFTEQLWQGELYPRWLQNMNAGFGSPMFFFYAPFPYYVTSLISLPFDIDTTISHSLAIGASLALITSGIAAYFWLKEFTSAQFALIIALIYMVLPYHFVVDLYIRFAFAELWTFVWMPLILLFSLKVRDGKSLSILWLTISLSLLMLTHLPTLIIFMPVFIGHFLFATDKAERKIIYTHHLFAIVLAVGLSAIYWVPAMMMQEYISMKDMFSGMFSYSNNFLLTGPAYGHNQSFWRYLTFITVLLSTLTYGAWLFSRMQTHLAIRKEINYWLVIALLSFLMTFPVSGFIWEWFPILQKIQFPWRFNTILAIAAVTVFALAVSEFQEIKFRLHGHKPFVIWFLLMGVLLLSQLIFGYQAIFFNRMDKNNIAKYLVTSRSPAEYRPYWVPEELFSHKRIESFGRDTPQIESDKTDSRWQIKHWQSRSIALQVNAASPSHLTLHQFYYPGWSATLDDLPQKLPVTPSKSGLLQFSVPAGQHNIVLTLETLPEEQAGQIISAIALLLCFLLGVKNYIYFGFAGNKQVK